MIRSSVELIEVVSSIHLGTQKLPTMNQETLKLTKLGLRVQSHLNNEKSMFVVNKSFNLWTFKNQSKLSEILDSAHKPTDRIEFW